MTAEEKVSFRELTEYVERFRAEMKTDLAALDNKLEESITAAANAAEVAVQTSSAVRAALTTHLEIEAALRAVRSPWEAGWRNLLFTLLGIAIAAIAGGIWVHMVTIKP